MPIVELHSHLLIATTEQFWQTDDQLTIHLGNCAITILVHDELRTSPSP